MMNETTLSRWAWRDRWAVRLLAMSILLVVQAAASAEAQSVPERADADTDARVYRQRIEAMTAKVNQGVVGVVSGGVDGTYVRIAADLSAVLDEEGALRVLPIIGKGSVQNLADVMYLRGVDIGIVQSDALAYLRREHRFPGIDKNVAYIAKLYNEEFHLLAGAGVSRLADLAGKKVNFDVQGSGTSLTASVLFDRLGIKVEATAFDQTSALDKLKRGEIAALAYVSGKPTRLFQSVRAEDGLKFLPVPLDDQLMDVYLPSSLTETDYPQLIPAGQEIQTVAVGAVMAVYNWSPGSERYQKVARFVDAFFAGFDRFLVPSRHPKWREVNLAAEVPGWTRFPPAQNWLRREIAATGTTLDPETRRAFLEYLHAQAGAGAPPRLPEQQQNALFEGFVRWQKQRAN